MRAFAIRQGTFVALAALHFGPVAEPTVASFRRYALAGSATLATSARSKRTRPAFGCAATNPILIGALVRIFLKAERIEWFLHLKPSRIEPRNDAVHNTEHDQAISEWNMYEEPQL